jgi:ubiquitin-like protein Pup
MPYKSRNIGKEKKAAEQVDEQPEDQRDTTLDEDVDAMLEEIDAVLEPNAEAWVAAFVQKGGE